MTRTNGVIDRPETYSWVRDGYFILRTLLQLWQYVNLPARTVRRGYDGGYGGRY